MKVGDVVRLRIAPNVRGEVVRIRDSDSHPFLIGVQWGNREPTIYYAENELEMVNAPA